MSHSKSNPFQNEERVYKQKDTTKDELDDLINWKNKYRKLGPVIFAKEQLKIDPLTGDPLLLSDGQISFLNDISGIKVNINNTEFSEIENFDKFPKDKIMSIPEIMFAIILAGRGNGKSFILAVYIVWKICTNDRWNLTLMGGAIEQSRIVQRYISGWRINNPMLNKVICKDIKGNKPEVQTIWRSSAYFLSCSDTSARGEHVREFILDEEVAGEATKEGAETMETAIYQVSTSKNMKIIRCSTCQNIHGAYYQTWQDAEKLGYKRYNWSLARYIDPTKDNYQCYKDSNPEHWFSAVPWTPDSTIRHFRKQNSNEKWLTEILGGISIGSGLVYRPEDLRLCICDRPECEDCNPYQNPTQFNNGCALLQVFMQLAGERPEDIPKLPSEALTKINERVAGQDYGHGSGADATVIIGRFRKYIFVLFADESTGKGDNDKLDDIVNWCKQWNVEFIRPDPAEHAYNNSLADKGLTVHEIDVAQDKIEYVHTSKKYIERHMVVIPRKFEALISSLKNITYKEGKIRKVGDHSFDGFIYAISRYGEIVDEDELNSSFWGKVDGANPFRKQKVIPEEKKEIKPI